MVTPVCSLMWVLIQGYIFFGDTSLWFNVSLVQVDIFLGDTSRWFNVSFGVTWHFLWWHQSAVRLCRQLLINVHLWILPHHQWTTSCWREELYGKWKLYHELGVYESCAMSGSLLANLVNTMAADALAPCDTMPSVAWMFLTMCKVGSCFLRI